jgi:hypothetical protein
MKHIKSYPINILNENIDYDVQFKYYWEQIKSINEWKPITDELYNAIEEEGWVQDLTDDMDDEDYDMNREIIKSGFVYKELDLFYNWQKDHLKSKYDYTVNLFTSFDDELKKTQEPPYYILDFIDYKKGIVYIIKFKKPMALQWNK